MRTVGSKSKRPVGKKSYRAKRTKSVRKVRTNFARAIRQVALNTAETKFTEYQLENQQLYHNGGAGPNLAQISGLLVGPPQGSTENSRNGDSVIGRMLCIRLWLSNKADRPNVMFRIILYSCPFATAAGSTDLFDPTTTNRMLGYCNKEKYRIILDKKLVSRSNDYSLEPTATLKEISRLYTINYSLKNRKIPYLASGSTQPKLDRDNIRIAIIPYDAYGTLTADNIASYAANIRFYYKDP